MKEIFINKDNLEEKDISKKIDRVKLFILNNKNQLILIHNNNTIQLPGGHREENESIDETARRELYEETGATEFVICPVCVYSVTGKNRVNDSGEETFGMLYFADITMFEEELHSEMEKVVLLDELPTEWTYPLIQPLLIEEYERRL